MIVDSTTSAPWTMERFVSILPSNTVPSFSVRSRVSAPAEIAGRSILIHPLRTATGKWWSSVDDKVVHKCPCTRIFPRVYSPAWQDRGKRLRRANMTRQYQYLFTTLAEADVRGLTSPYTPPLFYMDTPCVRIASFFPRIEYVCQEQRLSVLYFSWKTTLSPVRFSHPSEYQRQNSTTDFSASVFIVLPPLSEFVFIVTLLFRVDCFAFWTLRRSKWSRSTAEDRWAVSSNEFSFHFLRTNLVMLLLCRDASS